MKFSAIVFSLLFTLAGCKGINAVLKNKDPKYKLRMAEQYYVKKKWNYAQQLYEDVMPYFRGQPEFEDIYYKYAYTAYYQKDYLNAENLFKTYLEIYPNSGKAEEVDYMRAYTFYKQSPKVELDQTNTQKAIGMMGIFLNKYPRSEKAKEASAIIDELRRKLEIKDARAAQLYFDLGQYRSAAVAYNNLIEAYPDSDRVEEYKLKSIRSYFQFAELSIEEKKAERYGKVVEECHDFIDRFPQSSLVKEVEQFLSQSQNNLKQYTNEPA